MYFAIVICLTISFDIIVTYAPLQSNTFWLKTLEKQDELKGVNDLSSGVKIFTIKDDNCIKIY